MEYSLYECAKSFIFLVSCCFVIFHLTRILAHAFFRISTWLELLYEDPQPSAENTSGGGERFLEYLRIFILRTFSILSHVVVCLKICKDRLSSLRSEDNFFKSDYWYRSEYQPGDGPSRDPGSEAEPNSPERNDLSPNERHDLSPNERHNLSPNERNDLNRNERHAVSPNEKHALRLNEKQDLVPEENLRVLRSGRTYSASPALSPNERQDLVPEGNLRVLRSGRTYSVSPALSPNERKDLVPEGNLRVLRSGRTYSVNPALSPNERQGLVPEENLRVLRSGRAYSVSPALSPNERKDLVPEGYLRVLRSGRTYNVSQVPNNRTVETERSSLQISDLSTTEETPINRWKPKPDNWYGDSYLRRQEGRLPDYVRNYGRSASVALHAIQLSKSQSEPSTTSSTQSSTTATITQSKSRTPST